MDIRHPRLWIAAVLFLLGQALSASAQGYFAYNEAVEEAYASILSLKLPLAERQLEAIRQREPDNLAALHLANYIDFFTLYIGEEEAEFARRKPERAARLDRIAAEGNPDSPFFLFVQADIRLHWALARLKFGEYLGAFTDVSRAYKLLQENRRRFPDFMPTYKDLGILHAMVGTIPESYRWGLKWLGGLDGTIEQGRREMEMVVAHADEHDFFFAAESRALLAYLLLHLENKPEKAWAKVREAGFQPSSNLLHCFVMANVAMRSNRNDEALRILEARPTGPDFAPFHYLDLMLGLVRLRRLDPAAEAPLLRYAQNFRGQNFIKEAYQKLAWNALVHDDPIRYQRYLEGARQFGDATVDGDKAALREAEGKSPVPDPTLLRARLLFDGGYYARAEQELQSVDEADFSTDEHRLEYLYRRGRIQHGLEDYAHAISHYQRTIQLGSNSPLFYACNAALHVGLIYERLGATELATQFFELALSLYPEEYRAGIHQRAKAGLARLRQLNP